MRDYIIVTLVAALIAPALAPAEPLLQQVDVFTSGTDGYHAYRIPVIQTAPDGSLIALAEARKYNLGDPGHNDNDIDLVSKRSTDNGMTWSAMVVIEDPGERWSAANPVTLVDRGAERVWVIYVRSKPGRGSATSRPGTDDMQTIARYSDDNGASWSEPIDLTKVARDFDDPLWRCSVPGPGGGIQTQSGRLIVPCWKYPYGVFTIFSDDGGGTWRRGALAPGGLAVNEDQIVELADGRLLLDARQKSGDHRWRYSSSDGGETWSEPWPGEKVTPCACAAERLTLASAGDDRNRILWTGPKGPGRRNLVVRVSYDEGRTFPLQRELTEEPAAYSELTILKDNTIGVLWERGGYKYISFTRFNLEFLEPPEK